MRAVSIFARITFEGAGSHARSSKAGFHARHPFVVVRLLSPRKLVGTAGPGREATCKMLSKAYPFRLPIAAKELKDVVFVAIDDANGTVSEDQVKEFRHIAARGKPN